MNKYTDDNEAFLYLSLDLEMEQPNQEIIQIGACVGNIKTGEILGTYRAYCTPSEPLSPFIIQLTGITQETMDIHGKPLVEAYKGLIQFRNQFANVNCNAMTWGGGDTLELKQQVVRAYDIGKVFPWPLGRRWIDIKTWFQFRQLVKDGKQQSGLAKALIKCGLNFKGRKHDAMDDAVNTFRIAYALVLEFKSMFNLDELIK